MIGISLVQSFLVESKGHSNACRGEGGSLGVVGEADFQLQGAGAPWASNSDETAYRALVSLGHTELDLELQ